MAIIDLSANANEMAFRWRANNGPTLKAGLITLFFMGSEQI